MKLFDKNEASAKRLTLLSAIALGLALLATVGRIVCLSFFYDRIGYFTRGALLPIALTLIYTLAIIFFAVAVFCNKYDAPSAKLSKASSLAALLPAVAFFPLIVSGINAILSLPSGVKAPLFDLLYLVLSVAASAYFLSLAFAKQPSSASIVLGVASILWAAFAWMGSYLDFYVPMNSPDKLFFHLACIASMLLVFSEVRAIYEIPRTKMYYFSFFTAIVCISTSAIPSLIASSGDVFASYSLANEDLVFTAIFIYAAIRLFDKPGQLTETESKDSDQE